jgi:hypothetical protein
MHNFSKLTLKLLGKIIATELNRKMRGIVLAPVVNKWGITRIGLN